MRQFVRKGFVRVHHIHAAVTESNAKSADKLGFFIYIADAQLSTLHGSCVKQLFSSARGTPTEALPRPRVRTTLSLLVEVSSGDLQTIDNHQQS